MAERRLTFSERLDELRQMRFLEVRNLAFVTYKKPDGTSLLSYEETLDTRERVYMAVIQYELLAKKIDPDYLKTEEQREIDGLRKQLLTISLELDELRRQVNSKTAKPKRRVRR